MPIDYQLLVDEAMLGIVKTILSDTAQNGLTGEQSFYISFRTDTVGVILSPSIRKKYPREITIVLQYQFKNLIVFEDKFTVHLVFGGIPETITVPFASLTSFIDPVANFSLQFSKPEDEAEFQAEILNSRKRKAKVKHLPKGSIGKVGAQKINLKPRVKRGTIKDPDSKIKIGQKSGEIVAIDKFRKKMNKVPD